MNITPDSTITFYGSKGIPNQGEWTTFPISPGIQLLFTSIKEQQSTMDRFKILTVRDCQFVRSTGRIKIDLNQFNASVGFFYKTTDDVLRNIEYMSFVNPDLGTRVYYAFVTDYNYVNNDCVEISWALDPWMSYMDVVEMEPCNILREHMSKADDTALGLKRDYTPVMDMQTPEPLAIGEQLEPEVYTYSNDRSKPADVYPIMETLSRGGGYWANDMMTILYLAPIDFSKLDEAVGEGEKPSEIFYNFLKAVTDSEYGYYIDPTGELHPGIRYDNPQVSSRLISKSFIVAVPATVTSALSSILNNLTTWGVVDNILSMYSVPEGIATSAIAGENSIFFQTEWDLPHGVTPPLVDFPGLSGKRRLNPKLGTYPFSYIRLISPAGDIKELQYEHFTRNDNINFGSLIPSVDIFNAPVLQISPKDYKQGDMSFDRSGANAVECIRYAQFPSTPYVIDAWKYQSAVNALSLINNMTVDTHYEMQQSVTSAMAGLASATENVVQKGISVGASIASLGSINTVHTTRPSTWDPGWQEKYSYTDTSGVKGASPYGIAGSLFSGALAQTQMDRVANQANMYSTARDMLLGNTNNAAYANFAQTKPAYAADKYVGSSGTGSINFIRKGFVDILYQHVHLDDDILIAYDEWLRRFGFSSKRVGVPRVINYMHQTSKTTDGDLPSWNTYSENTGAGSVSSYKGYRCTYVQTSNCHIHGVPREVGSLIESMFDAGVQFWDVEAITRNNKHTT